MKCKLSEFGECNDEARKQKEWGAFCCDQHRMRYHYLSKVQPAILEQANARAGEKMNGHVRTKVTSMRELETRAVEVEEEFAHAPLTLADLAQHMRPIAPPSAPAPQLEVHRRKLAAGAR
jgi:hypothetical protein